MRKLASPSVLAGQAASYIDYSCYIDYSSRLLALTTTSTITHIVRESKIHLDWNSTLIIDIENLTANTLFQTAIAMPRTLSEYENAYANIRMTRSEGILEVELHSNGDSLLWCDAIHTDLADAFYNIGNDTENRAVILTGIGEAFCAESDPNSFQFDPSVPPVALDRIYMEGKAFLQNLLDIRVPVIAAVNGPARAHSELALLCDIVIASDTADFQDRHLEIGIVPGDGIHVVYPLVFGLNRGRYAVLTGAKISAHEALQCGAVSEVLPMGELHGRAMELARSLVQKPILGLRYTKEILTREVHRQLRENLALGLALEGFASGYGSWRAAT